MLASAADRIHSFAPWPEGEPVVLACSGGADSTFLALAWQFAVEHLPPKARALPPAQVVVVDHGQQAQSAAAAAQASQLYKKMGFEVEVRRAKLSTGANESQLRQARYQVLLQAAADHRAKHILLAHHADDQAETLLLRIFRGTGLVGLAGMAARRPLAEGVELLRPLLGLRAAAIRQELRQHGQSWLEDPSNTDPNYARRNFLRQLWPQLEELASAPVTSAMLRLQQEAALWQQACTELLAKDQPFQEMPSFLRHAVIREHLQMLGETVSPARLRDLEQSLLRRQRAGINALHALIVHGGRLELEQMAEGEA